MALLAGASASAPRKYHATEHGLAGGSHKGGTHQQVTATKATHDGAINGTHSKLYYRTPTELFADSRGPSGGDGDDPLSPSGQWVLGEGSLLYENGKPTDSSTFAFVSSAASSPSQLSLPRSSVVEWRRYGPNTRLKLLVLCNAVPQADAAQLVPGAKYSMV